MSRKYSNSKNNSSNSKYKVTKQDIINDTTACNIDNDVQSSNTLPDIVTYTMLKHPEYNDVILDNDMIDYLSCVTNGNRSKVSAVTIALWREQCKLFDECLNEFIKISIDKQEQDMILSNDKSDNIKMFVTKRWKPEYRDNVLPAQTIGTVINVNLVDGKDTIDKIKDITDDAIDKLIE